VSQVDIQYPLSVIEIPAGRLNVPGVEPIEGCYGWWPGSAYEHFAVGRHPGYFASSPLATCVTWTSLLPA